MRVPIPQLPIQTCAHNFRARSTTSRTTGPAISVEICGRKQEQNKRKGGGGCTGRNRLAPRWHTPVRYSQPEQKKKRKKTRSRSVFARSMKRPLPLSCCYPGARSDLPLPSSRLCIRQAPKLWLAIVLSSSALVTTITKNQSRPASSQLDCFLQKKKSVLVGKMSGLLKGTRVDH